MRAAIEGEPAISVPFKRSEAAVKASGTLAMGARIVDASILAAPKRRKTQAGSDAIKDRRVPDGQRR